MTKDPRNLPAHSNFVYKGAPPPTTITFFPSLSTFKFPNFHKVSMAPRMIPSKASMRSLFQAGKRTKQVQANEKKCEAPSASFRSFSPTGPVFNSFIDRIGMDDDDQYKGKEAEVIELTQVWLTISERSKFNVDVRKTNFSRSSHNHVNPAGLTVRARRISQDGSLGEAISVWTSNLYDPDVTHYDFLCKAEKDILAKLKEFTGSDWIPAPKVPSAAASPAEGDEQQDKRSTIITTSARSGRASLPPSASSAYDVPVVAQRGAGAAAGAMAEEHLLTKAIKGTSSFCPLLTLQNYADFNHCRHHQNPPAPLPRPRGPCLRGPACGGRGLRGPGGRDGGGRGGDLGLGASCHAKWRSAGAARLARGAFVESGPGPGGSDGGNGLVRVGGGGAEEGAGG